MTEDVQKDIDFYRRADKINGMAIAGDVFDVCYGGVLLGATKPPKVVK